MPDIDPISLEIVDDGGQDVNMNLHLSGDYYSLQAEAWAVGQKNGVDVPATDPTYHNNSKYYALAAQHAVGAPIINETVGPGDIVTFADGADDLLLEQLKVSIAPVQDLHGYNSPWVGGAGKNLFDISGFETVTNKGITVTQNNDGSVSVSGTATARATISLGNITISGTVILTGCPAGGSSSGYSMDIRRNGSTISGSTDTGSGSSAVAVEPDDTIFLRVENGYAFASTLVFRPMIRLSTVSDATWEPYENICPITGWDGVEVTRMGKNWYDDTLAQGSIKTANGTTSSNATRVRTANGTLLKPGTYTISCVGAYKGNAFFYKPEGTYIEPLDSNNMSVLPYTFTLTEETLCKFVFALSDDGNILPADVTNIQVEEGSVASSYTAYAGQTYSISFPSSAGTVYGGTLTINRDGSGSLVVDKAKLDLGDANWTFSTYRVSTTAVQGVIAVPANNNGKIGLISDSAVECSYNQTGVATHPLEIGVATTGAVGVCHGGQYTSETISDFISLISDWNIVFPLATPQTYSLTANQVHTLLGYNAIWADAGQVEVIYPADTKLYIDNLNQPATGVSF